MRFRDDSGYTRVCTIFIEVEMQAMSAHWFIKAGQGEGEQDGTKLKTLWDAPGKRRTGVDVQLFMLLLTMQSLLTASALVSIDR